MRCDQCPSCSDQGPGCGAAILWKTDYADGAGHRRLAAVCRSWTLVMADLINTGPEQPVWTLVTNGRSRTEGGRRLSLVRVGPRSFSAIAETSQHQAN